MHHESILKRNWVRGSAVIATAALSLALAAPAQAAPLTGVKSATADKNVVTVTFSQGDAEVQGKITFLDEGIFRFNVDPSGEFSEYAKPKNDAHKAKIQAQPDSSSKYKHPEAKVTEADGKINITAGGTTVVLDKATGKMSIKKGDKVVMEESAPLDLSAGSTVQTLVAHEGEDFFGGGTQNGRFIHNGESINIANESKWVDGGVASPNPFYWSSNGYGVMRNTWSDGTYDFEKTVDGTTTATHQENELDAYYFVADAAAGNTTGPIAQDLLQAYYKVTGNPVLLPEYAFYVGHLNAYNRDAWSAEAKAGYNDWQIKGHDPADKEGAGKTTYEKGGTEYLNGPNELVETLNGTGPTVATNNVPAGTSYDRQFSAQAKLDEYQDMDMPLGYFLPNDGYGAGYGQNGFNMTGGVNEDGSSSAERLAAVDANVENLKQFTEYANGKGVATGLWTQSDLEPDSNPDTLWHRLRDFEAEVTKGGVSTLKTDVAWVGHGYSMALDGIKTAYDIVTEKASERPNIITLDGWAGTQRFGGIWTGDQDGGNWEYIRFHIPTYIGQSLSGNPNVGSDMDGIFAGDPVIATRDYQWKTFTPLMLDMDGWGDYAKGAYVHGDPYTGISRMYLKLKSSLMPYIYTSAASAANIDTGNGDAGLPMIRAILLSDDSEYAASTNTQYEYTFGEDFLVAPLYENSKGDGVGSGDDVRNGIYLPNYNKEGEAPTIWIDYFTGEQYRGGQVLNGFDAPLWKLPLFVKANAIVPMYEPNDNPQDIDRAKRNVEFFATLGSNEYTQFEDDGTYIENKVDESNTEYGREGNISYGNHVSTRYTSNVEGKTATFTAEKSTGSYAGYKKDRATTFVVNMSEKPDVKDIVAKNGDAALKLTEVKDQAAFDKAEPKEGEAVFFYNEKPNLNYNTTAEDEAVRKEGFSEQEITTTPKLFVKFATTDVQANAQTLTIANFVNDGRLAPDAPVEGLNAPANFAAPEDLLTPTSITLTWDKVEGATAYDILIDGTVNSIPGGETTEFTLKDLSYHSTHTFQIRTRTQEGYSEWSERPLEVVTLEDPWRNTPVPQTATFEGGVWADHPSYAETNAFDHNVTAGSSMFHSGDNQAQGKAMVLDYGTAYKFDKLGYWPRTDAADGAAASGTVLQMKVETSLDGIHWADCGTSSWENTPAPKELQLNQTAFARYVRLTPVQTNNGYFTALEMAVYKVDGSSPFEVGSIAGDGKVNNTDYSHLSGNCIGRENRAPFDTDWRSHIAPNGADFNLNEAYDAYDMAFTMSKLDGGTSKTDKVSGNIAVIPSQTEVQAGDVITVDLYADDIKNANALGALIHFQGDAFEYVGDKPAKSPYTASMEDISRVTTTFVDGKQSVNISYQNKGDKDLYSGSGAIASFQLKAKKAGKVELPSTAWAIGPQLDYIEVVDDGSITYPDAPQPQPGELGQDAFNIKLTNDALPTDENGTNVSELVQQKSYNGLFDNSNTNREFEFKWFMDAATFDTRVGLPATLSFELKEPRVLDNVELFNGDKGSNGSINSLEALITFEDGTKLEFKGGDYSVNQPKYTFQIDDANKAKKVTKVEIKPLTSTGKAVGLEQPDNRMLTIGEINFNYTDPVADVESVVLGENATSLFVGELSQIQAAVTPDSLNYNQFEAESSDPAVASIVTKQVGEDVVNFVRANKPGKATITVKSVLDKTKTANYEVEVKEGVNTEALESALSAARALHAGAYSEASYAKLAEAVKAAEDLLKSGSYTDQQIAEATMAIREAIKGLETLPIDESKLINTEENKGAVKVAGFSSQCEPETIENGLAANALDYDDQSYWHSDYINSVGMPQYIDFDLGATYDLTGMKFLPRQNGENGDIFEARVYVADTAEGLKTASPVGNFKFDNNGVTLLDRNEFKDMAFGATGRFVRFEIVHAGGSAADQYASLSEVRLYGSEAPVTPQADVSALRALVDKIHGENLKAEDYTVETWTKFELALGDAEKTLADPEATQVEVDSQLAALQKAYEGLEKTSVPPVEKPSKEALSELVDKAEALNTTGKTPGSVQALKDAIASAKAVLAKDDASDDEIKSAYDALAAAIDGLKDVEQGGGNQGGNQGGNTGSGNGKPGSGLPQTGDPAAVAVVGTGLIGSVTAAIGAFLRRRRDR